MSSGLKPWKKGQSGNPAGRAALPPEIREARKADMVGFIKMVRRHWLLTDEEAQQRYADPNATRLEMAVYRVIEKATKDGDPKAFELMVNYMIGNIPDDSMDGLSDEDVRILNRAKEILAEKKKKLDGSSE